MRRRIKYLNFGGTKHDLLATSENVHLLWNPRSESMSEYPSVHLSGHQVYFGPLCTGNDEKSRYQTFPSEE